MKPKGLGELCAATSDLACQTGIEKKKQQKKNNKKKTKKTNRSFDHPQAKPNSTAFSFQKT